MRSPKTTFSGIAAILIAVLNAATLLIDGNPATNPDWAVTMAAIISGIGLIFSKDYDVTGGVK